MELPLLSSSSKRLVQRCRCFLQRHTLEEDNYLFKPIPLMHPGPRNRFFSRCFFCRGFLFGELQGVLLIRIRNSDQISCEQLWYPIHDQQRTRESIGESTYCLKTPAVLLFVSTLQVAPTPSWSHSFLAGRLQTDHFMMILGSSKKSSPQIFFPVSHGFPLFSKGITGKPPGWFFGKATTTENNQQLAGPCFPSNKTMFSCDQDNQQLAEASVQPRSTYSLPTKALVNRWWWFLSISQSCWDTADASEIRSPNRLRCYTKQKPISWDMVYQTSTGATNRSVRRISFEEWSTVRSGGE